MNLDLEASGGSCEDVVIIIKSEGRFFNHCEQRFGGCCGL